jgi:hypothetical protein
MASKREWELEKQRDRERNYTSDFLRTLQDVSTVADAVAFVKKNLPRESAVGRLRHTNLMHVLGMLNPSGKEAPHYRIERSGSLAPTNSLPAERAGYSAMFARMFEAGEISEDDKMYAEKSLSNTSGGDPGTW